MARQRTWRRFYYSDGPMDQLQSGWQSFYKDYPDARMVFDFDVIFTNLHLGELREICRFTGAPMRRDYVSSGMDDPWLRELLGLPVEESEDKM